MSFFTKREWVYVAEGVGTSYIKIGVSGDVDARIAGLAQANPFEVRLIHKERGDREAERALHERFADYRLRGEWFERRGALAAWVDTLALVRRAWDERADILCPVGRA